MDIIFENEMNNSQIIEFEKKIYYLSDNIQDFERIQRNNKIIGIKLILNTETDVEKIRIRAQDVIKNEIIGLKNVNADRIWEKDTAVKISSSDILKELIDSGLVVVPAEGQISLKEPLVSLFDCLDNIFKSISVHFFGCENYRFPTLLKMDVLKKVGYFESFPNLLMFTTRLKNTVDNYESFKNTFVKEDENEDFVNGMEEYCCGTSFGLPPTMCYYVYDMLSESEIGQKGITAVGKSFRYENKYEKPFERLWDFTIRETVFLGDYKFVKDKINGYKKVTIRLMEDLKLGGFCETAHDPFFLVENAPKRINIQKMYGSKYELRLKIDDSNSIAVGSFNLHGNFLAKRFGLYSDKENKKYCFTGCIGIGIERLLFSFLTQYGINFEYWPDLIKEGIENPKSINDNIKQFF